MPTYNILLMGASYGSLLASKLLFGGHKLHLVCLPAEADLINAEGFRVRLPVRGRKDPVELDSRKLPGAVTAGPATGVPTKTEQGDLWQALGAGQGDYPRLIAAPSSQLENHPAGGGLTCAMGQRICVKA